MVGRELLVGDVPRLPLKIRIAPGHLAQDVTQAASCLPDDAGHIPLIRPRVKCEHQNQFATGPGELLLHRVQVTAGLSGRPEDDHGLALEDCGGLRLAALAANQEHPVRAELPEAAADEHAVGGPRRAALQKPAQYRRPMGTGQRIGAHGITANGAEERVVKLPACDDKSGGGGLRRHRQASLL